MSEMSENTLSDAPALRQERRSLIDRRILRRADWRFLLPVPTDGFERMVLLGGPEGLLLEEELGRGDRA